MKSAPSGAVGALFTGASFHDVPLRSSMVALWPAGNLYWAAVLPAPKSPASDWRWAQMGSDRLANERPNERPSEQLNEQPSEQPSERPNEQSASSKWTSRRQSLGWSSDFWARRLEGGPVAVVGHVH